MSRCIVCRKEVTPGECPVDIEACPNLCEHKHIGADIGSSDATARDTISPTVSPEGLAFLEHVRTSTVPGSWGRVYKKPSFSCRLTNSNECSPYPETD